MSPLSWCLLSSGTTVRAWPEGPGMSGDDFRPGSLVRSEPDDREARIFQLLRDGRIQGLLRLAFVVRSVDVDKRLIIFIGEVGAGTERFEIRLAPVRKAVAVVLQEPQPIFLQRGNRCIHQLLEAVVGGAGAFDVATCGACQTA